jgi:hypothetical protein
LDLWEPVPGSDPTVAAFLRAYFPRVDPVVWAAALRAEAATMLRRGPLPVALATYSDVWPLLIEAQLAVEALDRLPPNWEEMTEPQKQDYLKALPAASDRPPGAAWASTLRLELWPPSEVRPSVRLQDDWKQGAWVFGNTHQLSYPQHQVIKALVDAFPDRLGTRKLQEVNSDAPKIIRELRAKNVRWWRALSTPDGNKGRGFGIVALPPHFP